MSNAPNSAQPTSSPSSSSTTATAPTSTQGDAQGRAAPTVSTALSNCAIYNSEDDLSDAPESPVFPTTPTSSTPPSRAAPPTPDSDSDLSSAPDSPVWPGTPKRSPTQPRCTERDCPVREAVRRHHQGPYLHDGERPWIKGTIFGDSNPPPHVWESWMKIQARERSSTVEDDWNVFGFLRWHVDDPNRRLLGN